MNTITRLFAAIKTALCLSRGHNGTFLRLPLLGLWLALNPFGNCFRPALILKTYRLIRNGRSLVKDANGKPVKDANGKFVWQGGEHAYTVQCASITLRTRNGETTLYWYGRLSFGWNSAHIARWLGNFQDTDFGGVTTYKGLLGSHTDL